MFPNQVQWQERATRVGKLLARLRQDDYPSPRVLGEWLGKCPKTIQRDLMHIRDKMHCPIEYDSSRRGWHLTDRSYALPLAFASKQDLQALLILGQSVAQYAGTPLGAEMQKAFERLLELFKDNEKDLEKERAFAKRVCFAGAPPPKANLDIWKAIFTALQIDQRLEIEYRKGGSDSPAKRKFDPYGLIIRDRAWFLHGYCHLHRTPLTLFIPYISRAALLEEFFDVPPDFNLMAYTHKGFLGLQSDAPARKVLLRFQPQAAEAALSAPFSAKQNASRERSGCLRVEFETNALFQLEREILHWGSSVEVLKPKVLRNKVRKMIREMGARYRA